MKVTFHYTLRDKLAFAAYHLPRNPMTVLISLGFLLFITFESVVPGIPKDTALAFQVLFVVFAEAILALLIAGFWALIVSVGMLVGKDKAVMSERTITLGEECFVSDTSFAHSEYRWPMVQKLARTGRHAFLYFNKESALIVPRRAFKSDADWNAFYDFCESKARRNA
jgi:hypothetical protein